MKLKRRTRQKLFLIALVLLVFFVMAVSGVGAFSEESWPPGLFRVFRGWFFGG
ncbi:MAG: hypothetical protein ACOY94_16645 [Bacillota bacterium]